MKRVFAAVIVMALVALVGCENAQLIECQEQNATLQAQLDEAKAQAESANAAVAQKDEKIAQLEVKNIEAQNTAMQSITTMMTKQAEKDKQLKAELSNKKKQVRELIKKVTELEKQIADHTCAVPETAEEQM